jgi:hypothetical protein
MARHREPLVRRRTTFVAPYIVEATVASRDPPGKQTTLHANMKPQFLAAVPVHIMAAIAALTLLNTP